MLNFHSSFPTLPHKKSDAIVISPGPRLTPLSARAYGLQGIVWFGVLSSSSTVEAQDDASASVSMFIEEEEEEHSEGGKEAEDGNCEEDEEEGEEEEKQHPVGVAPTQLIQSLQ